MSALRIKKAGTSTSQQRRPSANLSGPERANAGYLNTSVGDGQSVSYSNEMRDELLAEEAELCRRIDTFFAAMKVLQRAVNKKEDISQLKVEFETKQRALQKLNKQIQARITQNDTTKSSYSSTNRLQKSRTTRLTPSNSRPSYPKQTMSSSHRLNDSGLRSKAIASPHNKSPARTPVSASRRQQASKLGRSVDNLSGPIPKQEKLGPQPERLSTQPMPRPDLQRDDNLKRQLVQKITSFESDLLQKYKELQARLASKENELEKVKEILVEKLKELESSFVDLGEHLNNAQSVTNFERTQQLSNLDALEERKTATQPKMDTQNTNLLSKFLSDESTDKDLEALTKENQGLHEQIGELRKQLKEAVPLAKHAEVESAIQGKDEAMKRLIGEKRELVKMFDTLSKERDQGKAELAKSKAEKINTEAQLAAARKEQQATKLECDNKEALFDQSVKAMKQKLQDVQEEKIVAQKEAQEKAKAAKLLEEETQMVQHEAA